MKFKDPKLLAIYDALVIEGIMEDKYIPTRKPTHGTCCTCQDCGWDHDCCVCFSNQLYNLFEALAQ